MSVRDLIPWGRSSTQAPTVYRGSDNPFLALHREMNRLFDDVFRSFDTHSTFARFPAWSSWPNMEVAEDKNGVLTATLPETEQEQSKAKRIAINSGT